MPFVRQLAVAFAKKGVKVSVICPLPINLCKEYKKVEEHYREAVPDSPVIDIFFPKFIGFGQRRVLFFNTSRLTILTFERAVTKIIKQYDINPDVFYGHFITPSGIVACRIGKITKRPAFIAYGESSPWSIKHFGAKRVRKELASVSGIISVSSSNRDDLLSLRITSEDKIGVFPNGFDDRLFYPVNQLEARNHFSLPADAFIVSFVGHFIERKGISKLEQAIDQLDNVYLICAGKGPLKPTTKKCLFAAPVNQEDLRFFYSASDVFVLPTTNEGCCNAIIEAIACEIPIVSSNLPFNNDVLNDSNSIKIDPLNVDEIKKAILKIRSSQALCVKMKNACQESSMSLSINSRAERILSFISERANL